MLQKLDLKGGGLIKTIVRSHRTMPTVFFYPEEELVPNQIVTGLSLMKFLEKPKGH